VSFTQPDPVIGVHRLFHSKWIQKGTVFVNANLWSSPKTDQLMDSATVENNPEKRASLYHELQRELVEASPIIWINELDWVTVYNKGFDDLITGPLGVFSSFEKARKVQ